MVLSKWMQEGEEKESMIASFKHDLRSNAYESLPGVFSLLIRAEPI